MSIRPGQIFTTDFVLSAFVFFVMVNVTYLMWIEMHQQQNVLAEEKVLQEQVYHVTSLLVRTPGYPPDWTAGNVEILGLASPDHVIQDAKLDELDAMTDADIKQAMGITQSTQFLLNVTNATQTMHVDGRDLVWGSAPSGADTIVVAERAVIVNATDVYRRGTLRVILWR